MWWNRIARKQSPGMPARAALVQALEPRMMFDGAVAATLAETADAQPTDAATTDIASYEMAATTSGGTAPGRQEVVFVDAQVQDYQQLLGSLQPGTEVVVLDSGADGLQQIADYLQGRSGIDAIHLLSHGDVGKLQLAGQWLDSGSLEARSDLLASIGQALTDDGDILLYGCQVGADGAGSAFLQALAAATGADVAASDDPTGASDKGGDWTLEVSLGSIETASLTGFDAYASLLAAPSSENFDGVAVDASGYSFGDSPRVINGWTIRLLDAAGNDAPDYIDVTQNANDTALAGSGDGALALTGYYGEAQAAQFQSTSGDAFWLRSFSLENNTVSSALRVVGYRDGVIVASQDITETNLDALGSTITLDHRLDQDWQNIDEFRIVQQDGSADILFYVDDISVDAANLPPVIGNLDGDSSNFIEGSAPVLLDVGSNATVIDGDSSNFSGGNVTVTLVAGGVAGVDVLGIRNQGTGAGQIGVSGTNVTYGGTTIGTFTGGSSGNALVVTFNANASADAVQALVRNLTYANQSDDPGASQRTVQVTVTDSNEGTSNPANVVLSITPVNDAPTLSATGNSVTFTENGSAVDLFSNVSVGTVEAGQTITGLTLAVSNVANGASEILRIDGTDIALFDGNTGTTINGVTYSVSVTTGTATLTLTSSGLATATAQSLVDGITYRNASEAPTTTARTVTLTSITDSGGIDNGGSDTRYLAIAANVAVVAVNDAPTLSGGPYALPATNENTISTGTLVSTLLAGLSHADADGPAAGIAVTVTAGSGTWQYSLDGSSWNNIGTVSGAAALLLSDTTWVRYAPDGMNGETATLTFRAWDQTSGAASTNMTRSTADTSNNGGSTAFSSGMAQANIVVQAVNDAPINVSLSNTTVAENSSTATELTIGTLTSTDVDIGDSHSYSIVGGTDAGVFVIVGTQLRFQAGTVLDYETQSSYTVIVRSTDSGGAWLDKAFTITLTDVNEAPIVATPLADQTGAVGAAFSYTVPAGAFADPDAGTTLSYSATLTDGSALPAWLQFDAASRTFSGTPGADGAISVRVTASDGSLSVYDDFTLTITQAPPEVTGIVRAGGAAQWTNADTLVFTVTFSEAVTGVDASDFSLSTTGTAVGSITAIQTSDNITYSVTLTGISGDGTLRLNLNASGTGIANGNASPIAGGYSSGEIYILDNTAPSTPSLTIAPASDSGTLGDRITNVTTPTLTGTAEANSSVRLYDSDGTTLLGMTTADGSGNWSITSSALAEGSHNLTVTATDAVGNISGASATLVLVIDTTAPATPAVTSPALSNSAAPLLSGTAETGSTVTISIGGATYTTVASSGAWSLDLASATPVAGVLALNANGANPVSVTATDAAGNVSATASQTLIIDTTAPTAPAVTSPALTNSTTPLLSGTAETGSTVTVSIGGATYTTVASGGAWSLDLASATPVAGSLALDVNGANPVSVTSTDAAGNTSSAATQTLIIDTAAPTAPTVTSPALSNSTTPLLSGTAETGSSVTVSIGGATYTTVTSGGAWSLDLASATPVAGVLALDTNGANPVSVTATDAAGNVSATASQTLLIDTTAPATPAVTSPALTNSTAPLLSGTAESGSTVTISIGGATYTTVASGGAWSLDLASATPVAGSLALDLNGSNAVSVISTDAAGNSSSSAAQSLVIDTQPASTVSVGVPPGGAYVAGQPLDFTVNLSEAVIVDSSGGTPRIAITLEDGSILYADYLSGSGSPTLVFRLTLAEGQADGSGFSLGGAIETNGGSLRDAAGNDTLPALNGVGDTSGILLDSTAPSVSSIVRDPGSSATTLQFLVTFSEAVTGVDAGDFSLLTSGTAAGTIQSLVQVDARTYRVQVGNLSGMGGIGLALNAAGSGISDAVGNTLSASAAGEIAAVNAQQPQGDPEFRANPPANMPDMTPAPYPSAPPLPEAPMHSPLLPTPLFEPRTLGSGMPAPGSIFLPNGTLAPGYLAQVFASHYGSIGGSAASRLGFAGGDGGVFGASTLSLIFGSEAASAPASQNSLDGKADAGPGLPGIFGAPTLGQQLHDMQESEQRQLRDLALALGQLTAVESQV
ncbi:DUF4347 domain-containing protein [Phytopseudomonas dryadis]|uniref:Cadherin domain-containing protein n=1 Tax=Phytopseudomonas dryadis TaxID=2487520 RepID=A0A4Q9QWH4_9GAMM|nr:DUF4347 domain-containing protein [Pseudomonas dryadis]TBU87362.1 hypothetical protein DNK44_20720 [Pseudomonas dryadis]